MDILKKAYSNLEECKVDQNGAFVQGKKYDQQQIITFPTKKSKEYTLGSILFFLINSNKTIGEYMSLCKQNGFLPISHVDKTSILSEIENYEPINIKGFFIGQRYENNKEYEVPNIKKRNIIIVPNSLVSKINLESVERLLIKGSFEYSIANPLSENIKEINIKDQNYKIVKNSNKNDWDKVKAVFIENSRAEECKKMLLDCPKDVLIFSLEEESFKCIKLEIVDGVLKNREKVLNYFE